MADLQTQIANDIAFVRAEIAKVRAEFAAHKWLLYIVVFILGGITDRIAAHFL